MVVRGAEEDSGGCECMGEGVGSNGRQKNIKKIDREGSDVVCNTGLPLWPGDMVALTESQQQEAEYL